MNKKLVFISGPSGAGKTTLLHKIRESIDVVVPKLVIKTKELYWGDAYRNENINHFHRQCLKSAQRALENEEIYAASINTKKTVIGDRCIYDDTTYAKAMKDLGWITKDELRKIEETRLNLYRKELLRPYAIILNPPIDICWRHLQSKERRNGKIKFMQNNVQFAQAVQNRFCDFKSYNPDKVLYIDTEANTNEIEKIRNWLE